MIDTLEGRTVVVPRFVTTTLEVASRDLDGVAALLGRASDIEWVSDVAGLYQCRLDHARRLVLAVHTRVREASTSVRVLSFPS